MTVLEIINECVLAHHPDVEAIYLFGSFGTEDESSESDVDIALLLPATQAKKVGHLMLSELCLDL